MIPSRSVLALSVGASMLLLAGCSSRSQLASFTPAEQAQASTSHRSSMHPDFVACPGGGYPLLTFIGDQSSNVINAYKQGFGPPGLPYCTISNPSIPGISPWGIAVDSAKDLYAGYADGSVWKFAPPYNTAPLPICTVAPLLPYGMAVDNYGDVFVGMFNSNQITVCNPPSAPVVLTDPNLYSIRTIAAGPKGTRNIFAVGYKAGTKVVEIDETYDGVNWLPLQTGGPFTPPCPNGFQAPGALALGKATAGGVDHLWYADGGNGTSGCIYKFKPPYTGASILTAPAVSGVNSYTGQDYAIALNSNDSILFAANETTLNWTGHRYHSNNGVIFPTNPATAVQGAAFGIAVTPPSAI